MKNKEIGYSLTCKQNSAYKGIILNLHESIFSCEATL
jgi:hypothetical protein